MSQREGSGEVQLQGALERVVVQILKGDALETRRARDEQIETAQSLDRCIDESASCGRVREIGGQQVSSPASGLDAFPSLLSAGIASVIVDCHVGTSLSEGDGDGLTQPLTCTGHQRP
jgi:hypothetical protein